MKRRSCRLQSNTKSKKFKSAPTEDSNQIVGHNELLSIKYPLNHEYTFERQFSLVVNWLNLWNSKKTLSLSNEDSCESSDGFIECFLLLGSPEYNLIAFIEEVANKMKYATHVMDFSTDRSMKCIMSRFNHSVNSDHVKTELSNDPIPIKKTAKSVKGRKSNSISNFFTQKSKTPNPRVESLKENIPAQPYNKVTLQKNSLIIFDDVHLISSNYDKSFWPGVNHIIKKSRRPVILITQPDYQDYVVANLECDINVCNFSLDQPQIHQRIKEQFKVIAEKENSPIISDHQRPFSFDYLEIFGSPYSSMSYRSCQQKDISYENLCSNLQWNGNLTLSECPTLNNNDDNTNIDDDLSVYFKKIDTQSEIDLILTSDSLELSEESIDYAELYIDEKIAPRISDELNGCKSFLSYFLQEKSLYKNTTFECFNQKLNSHVMYNPMMNKNIKVIFKDLRASGVFLNDYFSPARLDCIRMDFLWAFNQIFAATKSEREHSRKKRFLGYFDKIGIYIEEYQKKIFENSLICL